MISIRILDTFRTKGRGLVLCVDPDAVPPDLLALGSVVRQSGHAWTVVGRRHPSTRPSVTGELLVRLADGEPEPVAGEATIEAGKAGT